nr:hypothetical protein [uncultured Acetatifactor sp.]
MKRKMKVRKRIRMMWGWKRRRDICQPALHRFRMCFREKKPSRWKRPEGSMQGGKMSENWKTRKEELVPKNQKIRKCPKTQGMIRKSMKI